MSDCASGRRSATNSLRSSRRTRQLKTSWRLDMHNDQRTSDKQTFEKFLTDRGIGSPPAEDPRETRERERNQAVADSGAQKAAWVKFIEQQEPTQGSLENMNLRGLRQALG